MIKLIQYIGLDGSRKVGVVKKDVVEALRDVSSVYGLFESAQSIASTIESRSEELLSGEIEVYNEIAADNRLLLPFTHPDPYHTWITGTGLTHLGSASSRNAMHEKNSSGEIPETDSIRMFRMGVENGRMQSGVPGVQPEWFYKGNGLIAVNPGQAITSPSFALDAGEEPEIVGVYVIDQEGNPFRVGFCLGNEFSDHITEKTNYLYLAHSKLRQCSYGPELLVGDLPLNITGKSSIIRGKETLWEKEFLTGEDNMSHNIQNLEHHHFKYEMFRQPGDVHIHFFGTSVLSFADKIETEDGDVFKIEANAFGHPLINPLIKQR